MIDWSLPVLPTPEIALSGGCIQNAVLTEALVEGFARHGVTALIPVPSQPAMAASAWVRLGSRPSI